MAYTQHTRYYDAAPHDDRTHQNCAQREKNARLQQRRSGEVKNRVGENDHVRSRNQADVARDGVSELVVERSLRLDEAYQTLLALLRWFVTMKSFMLSYLQYFIYTHLDEKFDEARRAGWTQQPTRDETSNACTTDCTINTTYYTVVLRVPDSIMSTGLC